MCVQCLCFIMLDRGLLTEESGMNNKGQYMSGLSVFLELPVVTKNYRWNTISYCRI
jgi:hypothetical protein